MDDDVQTDYGILKSAWSNCRVDLKAAVDKLRRLPVIVASHNTDVKARVRFPDLFTKAAKLDQHVNSRNLVKEHADSKAIEANAKSADRARPASMTRFDQCKRDEILGNERSALAMLEKADDSSSSDGDRELEQTENIRRLHKWRLLTRTKTRN